MPAFHFTQVARTITSVCHHLDAPVFKSLNPRKAVATLVDGLNASQSAEELTERLFSQLPQNRQSPQDRTELASCVENVVTALSRLPAKGAVLRHDLARETSGAHIAAYAFNNRNTEDEIDLSLNGTILVAQDGNGTVASDLKVFPVDAHLHVDESRASVGVKACAVDLNVDVTPHTSLSLEALCASAEAGIDPRGLMLLLKEGRVERGVGVLRKKLSLAEMTVTAKLPAANGCRYEASGKIGLGSVGPEIKIAENGMEAYDGMGALGLGGGGYKICAEKTAP